MLYKLYVVNEDNTTTLINESKTVKDYLEVIERDVQVGQKILVTEHTQVHTTPIGCIDGTKHADGPVWNRSSCFVSGFDPARNYKTYDESRVTLCGLSVLHPLTIAEYVNDHPELFKGLLK